MIQKRLRHLSNQTEGKTTCPSVYTNDALLKEAKAYYTHYQVVPTVRSVPWGALAVRRFGNWTTFLKEAELPVEYLTRTSRYSKAFFIQEVQQFYRRHHEIPTSNEFSWSGTAIQRFGSWNTLIREAGYTPRKPGGAYYLK